MSKKSFNDYQLHLEFLLPFRPSARSQARGNGGLYHVNMYENQILDSFGLEGLHNECGGIYSIQNSMINACFPPLSWQTYDIDFVNARGTIETKESNARLTVKLNGIPIHDGLKFPGKPAVREMVRGHSRSNQITGAQQPSSIQKHLDCS